MCVKSRVVTIVITTMEIKHYSLIVAKWSSICSGFTITSIIMTIADTNIMHFELIDYDSSVHLNYLYIHVCNECEGFSFCRLLTPR